MKDIVSLVGESVAACADDASATIVRLLLECLMVSLFTTVVSAAPLYGFDQRLPIGPFLNNILPPQPPSATWTATVAFPHLNFNEPLYLLPQPRSNRLFVVDHGGKIYSFTNDPNTSQATLVLDLSAVTQANNDCGMLGMAFHPDFGLAGSTNRNYIYVYYTYSPAPTANPTTGTRMYDRLSRFTIPDGSLVADPNSELVLINQYDENYWHNGGGMFFGRDGYLYLSVGDEGTDYDGLHDTQMITNGLFSGVLRIDVNQDPAKSHPIRRQPKDGNTLGPIPAGWPHSYTANYYIPNDNPWLDPNGSVLEEFYCIGLRSPHRMSYDAANDRIWLGDVGQSTVEEVDLLFKGANCQWEYMEGNIPAQMPKPATIIGTEDPPLYTYKHDSSGAGCVIGGYVYEGATNAAYLGGKYIFGDYVSGQISALTYDGVHPPTVAPLCSLPPTSLVSFGVDQNNELYMCNINDGNIYKLTHNTTLTPGPPALLSQTGVYTNLATLAPNPALIPYNVNSPLWSDNAVKSRWMAVPYYNNNAATNGLVTFETNGAWQFPVGTVLVKTFELPTNDADPTQLKRLETRLFTHATNGSWYGVTYKWRSDNSDADLLPSSLLETNLITTATGGTRTQLWYYPSRSDCLICHNANAGYMMGLRTCQLNGNFTYPETGVTDNQLRTLSHAGLFTTNLAEASIPSLPQSVNISDTNASLELRVRSYLDSNCANCHRPNGAPANFDARLETPLTLQNIVNATPLDPLGVTNAEIVAPQSPAQSILYLRDSAVGAGQMPPLARNTVDTNYIATLTAWINSLPVPGPIPSPWQQQDVGSVGVPGNATYADSEFTVTGSGVDIWDVADSFHFVYQPLLGNAVMTAKVEGLYGSGDGWPLAGVMIRQDLTGGSKEALSALTTGYGMSGDARITANTSTVYQQGALYYGSAWVRVTRTNNVFTAFQSADGTNWQAYFTNTINMSGTVYAGLAFTSHSNSLLGTATFSHVLLTGTNVDNPPVAMPDVVTRPMSQGVSTPVTNLLAKDSDPDGNPLTLLSVTNATLAGATVNLTNNVVTYWPLFGDTNPGGYNYIISDGRGGLATGLVSVAVVPDPAGTDVLNIAAVSGSSLNVNLTGIPGFTYTVQYSDTLVPPNWQNLSVGVADSSGLITVPDTMPIGSTNRFYRAVRGIAP